MTSLYLLEPDPAGTAWFPFAGVRPVAELRAGLWRIRERWEGALQRDTTAILGSHVVGFAEFDEPPSRGPMPIEGPSIVAASWFAPSGAPIESNAPVRRLTHAGSTVGWVIAAGEHWARPTDDGPGLEVDGVLLRGAYDLVTALERLLPADCADFRAAPSSGVPEGSIVLGDPADVISLRAMVEPGVVFDVRNGPVVIEEGAEVRSGSRLEGPMYVGSGTRVLGGFLRASVFGPECRVRGEIAACVFLGYGNKAHDGFIGHSVVGHWVNLGAGTTTSNLKNTYGPIRLDIGDTRIETGRTNLGTLFGDHAKTAIGTLMPTGAVVGAGANVFGATSVPKYVPPFSWGCAGERLSEEGFLTVARRVLARREVAWSDARQESLRRTYERSGSR